MNEVIEHSNLRDQVYSILKRRIILRDIRPGEKIQEEDLARSLNVSRTPIREALLRLEHEGIVRIVPRRGAHVISLSKEQVIHVLEVREVLEGLVARLATERMTPESKALLRSVLDDIASGTQGEDLLLKYTPADIEFHAVLLRYSHNDLLQNMMEIVNAHLQMVRLRTVALPGRAEQTIREHYEVLDAIERGDASGAEELMRRHVASVRNDAVKHINLME